MRLSPRLRSSLAAALLLAGLSVFAFSVHRHYPLSEWLFFRYLRYAALCALQGVACLSVGSRLVWWLAGTSLRFSERVLIGFALGTLVFGLGTFVVGVCQLYGVGAFFGLPLLLLLAGGRRTPRRLIHGLRRLSRRADGSWAFAPRSVPELVRALGLLLGLLFVYSQVLTPENVSFDARWYHLAIAEQYAGQGGIRPFLDGWYLGTYPQLASWLYTWAFQAPGTLFDHVALASHLEWMLFVASIPGVALLARRLVPGLRLRFAGASLFLFPSLWLYDSNLNAGADHVLAFWALPLALCVCMVRRAIGWKSILLLSGMASGALLTKYQAIYLVVPASLVVLVLLARARRLALLVPGTLAVLLLTAPHWLKNLLYHGDPLYPLLHRHLPTQPFHAGAAEAMDEGYFPHRFMLSGPFGERLLETLKALFTFSFVPHNWKGFDIPEPTFGSLFSLLGPLLALLGRTRRVWLLLGCTYLGVFLWFWTNHQDRFLQALLPWMATLVVVVAALLWRLGGVVRASLCALIAFQVVWGSDVFFYPTHKMIKEPTIKSLADFLSAGHRGHYEQRFEHWGSLGKVTEALPEQAHLLLHDQFLRLGLGRPAWTDEWGFQGALSYRELRSTRAVWQRWRELGITHVAWGRSRIKQHDSATLARQALFYEAALRATRGHQERHGVHIAELRPEPPALGPRLLTIVACEEGDPAAGTFEVVPFKSSRMSSLQPATAADREEVTVMAVRSGCRLEVEQRADLRENFELAANVGDFGIWVRRARDL